MFPRGDETPRIVASAQGSRAATVGPASAAEARPLAGAARLPARRHRGRIVRRGQDDAPGSPACPSKRSAGRVPARAAVEAVEVVVASVGLHRGLGCHEVCPAAVGRAPRLQGLSRTPRILPLVQGVSIWVRMWRIASSSRVRWKRLSIAAHDGHEGRAVVAHQLERHAAQLDRLAEEVEDRLRLLARQRPDAEQVAAVVVDQRRRSGSCARPAWGRRSRTAP